MPYGLAPDARALRFDIGRIVKDRELADNLRVVLEGQIVSIHGLAPDVKELVEFLVAAVQTFERNRWGQSLGRQIGAFSEHVAAGIVDDHTCETLAVSESLHDLPELFMRSTLQRRFHDFLQALRQNLSAPYQIGAKSAFLREHLVPGNKECDEGNPDDQKNY